MAKQQKQQKTGDRVEALIAREIAVEHPNKAAIKAAQEEMAEEAAERAKNLARRRIEVAENCLSNEVNRLRRLREQEAAQLKRVKVFDAATEAYMAGGSWEDYEKAVAKAS